MKFLKDEQTWPFRAPGKIFLAHAMKRLGASQFGDAWSDIDPFTRSTTPLESYSSIHPTYENKLAVAVLQRHYPGIDLPQPKSSDEPGPAFYPLTEQLWDLAREHRRQELDDIETSKEQYWSVAETIRECCAYSRLISFALELDGSFEPIPDSRWNLRENFWAYFKEGRISIVDVIGSRFHPLAKSYDCWIFLDQDGLGELTTTYPEVHEIAGGKISMTDDPLLNSDKRHIGKLKEFQQWIEDQIKPSPSLRTITKDEILSEGERYQLSRRQADRARSAVIDKLPDEVKKAWRKPGPI